MGTVLPLGNVSIAEDDNSTDIVTVKPHNSFNLMVSICSIHKSIKLFYWSQEILTIATLEE